MPPETDTLTSATLTPVAEAPIVTTDGQPDTIVALAPVTAAPSAPAPCPWDEVQPSATLPPWTEPRAPMDWQPLREKARKRARIVLTKVWEDPAKGLRLHRVDHRRFCYKDYPSKQKRTLSVTESPDTLGIKTDGLVREGERKRNTVFAHYIISVRRGKLAVYHRSGDGKCLRHTMPRQIDLTAGVAAKDAYPETYARFNRKLLKLLRPKARAKGVKLAKGDDLTTVLESTLWPALEAVKAHHRAVRNGQEWIIQQQDRWLLRHMHCTAAELPKSMTGYGSKAVTKLFWESMRPPPPRFNEQGSQFAVSLHDANLWRAKWSWLALLRTWLPVDFTQQILRAPKIAQWDDEWSKDPRVLRKLLKEWEPKRVVRILTETCADSFTIRDTLRMLEQRETEIAREAREWPNGLQDGPFAAPPPREPLPRARDCKELHDWLSAEQRRAYERQQQLREARRRAAMTPEQRAAEEERERLAKAPFEHSDELKAVAGRQVTTPDGKVHTIILPHGPDELQAWGNGMHNCIGSYAWRIRDGECLILGVKTEDVGNKRPCDWGIEIRGGEICQFRGVCNEEAPSELQNLVEQVLVEAKVVHALKARLRMDVQVEMQALRGIMAGQAVVMGQDVAPMAAAA